MLNLLLHDVLNKMADPSSYDAALQGQEWRVVAVASELN